MGMQTPIFSSCDGMNLFSFWFLGDKNVTVTPEIRADLEKFVENVLDYFNEYDIPGLQCELLWHHLENLQSSLCKLGKTPLNEKICWHREEYDNLGKKPPSVELTKEPKVYIYRH